MLKKIQQEPYEYLFLSVVTVIVILAYVKTTTFLPTSAVIPQFMLYIVAAALVGIVVMKFRGNAIEEKLGLSETNAGFDLPDAEEDNSSALEGLYDLNTIGVTQQFIWIISYVLGVVYIGFFTVSTLFSIVYILANETSEFKRRIPLAIGWTAVILGVLYVLFVEFLQVSSVWRLGFLP